MIPVVCKFKDRIYLARPLPEAGRWALDAGIRGDEGSRGFEFVPEPPAPATPWKVPDAPGSPLNTSMEGRGRWRREVACAEISVFFPEVTYRGIDVFADHWVTSWGPDQLRLRYTPYNTVARRLGNALFQAGKPVPKDLDEWAEWDRDAATLERLGWKLDRSGFDRVAWGVVPLAELELIEGPAPEGPF